MKNLLFLTVILIGFMTESYLFASVVQEGDPVLKLNTISHHDRLLSMSIDESEKFLLTISMDVTAKLWDAEKGDLVRTFRLKNDEIGITSGAISPNGQIVVLGSSKGNMYIFNANTGELLQLITTSIDDAFSVSSSVRFFPSTTSFLVVWDNSGETYLKRYDFQGNQFVVNQVFEKNEITDIKQYDLNKGKQCAFIEYQKTKQTFKLLLADEEGNVLNEMKLPYKEIPTVSFSKLGDQLILNFRENQKIQLYDVSTLSLISKGKLQDFGEDEYLNEVHFSSTGDNVLGSAGQQKIIEGKWMSFIRIWKKGIKGKYVDIVVGNDADYIKYFIVLSGGDIIFLGNVSFGRIDEYGKGQFLVENAAYKFNKRDRSHLKVNESGSILAFTPLGSTEELKFSVLDGLLSVNSNTVGLSSFSDDKAGVKISNWGEDNESVKINDVNLPLGENSLAVDIFSLGDKVVVGTANAILCSDVQGNILWTQGTKSVTWAVKISGNDKFIVTLNHGGEVKWYRTDNKKSGIKVDDVLAGSVAEKSGLEKGDIIKKVNGVLIDESTIRAAIMGATSFTLGVVRRNKEVTIKVNKLKSEYLGFRYSVGVDNLLLTLFIDPETKKWIISTPDGYYKCAPGAEHLVGWHLNSKEGKTSLFFSAAKFRSKYYRPDIIDNIFKTYSIVDPNLTSQTNVSGETNDVSISEMLPPTVRIISPVYNQVVSQPVIDVQFTVESNGSNDFTELKFLIDGRPVDKDRGFKLIEKDAVLTKSISIPKKDILLQVIAKNKYGWSEPVTVKVIWKGKEEYDQNLTKPNLYVLSIGVSDYEKDIYDLKYAAKDAQDFSSMFQKQEGGLYNKVIVKNITDENATKNDILDGLDWIQKECTSRDLAMIFLAGHGVNDNQGTFFYLPYEADVENLRRSALMFNEIKYTTSVIAGKVILFVDACHSGNVMGTRRSVVVDVNNVVRDLSDVENGVVVFTSSTGKQFSLENDSWGNGAFTEAIIDGLNGKADLFNNGVITIKTLDAFVSQRVKELTDGKQSPTAVIPQSIPDFPILIIK